MGLLYLYLYVLWLLESLSSSRFDIIALATMYLPLAVSGNLFNEFTTIPLAGRTGSELIDRFTG